MIHVDVFKDKKNNIVKYIIYGHSGYAKVGSDIVCAAVSSVSQSAVLGLTRVLNIQVGLEVRESMKEPYLECVLPQELSADLREKANIILETMLLTLREFEEQYRKYIRILEQEV
ncbi:ribosomal-processing cysteine protease Prp [Petroclostridium sp. X23]|jgi:uncharacterized protein YsxB (DUF464 family)|uniref:ribosomal-processing cysteine protease Prp n=1 Tax=Petroclostridium sp. X23 TaxID=3045146 RepID=UPI0024AD4533|nr:ribosomal-processing cysteine protease Prp [Petroclostridium sp. X23]WHH58163.1 ribosomal-processing cysteine protease Prp [Petroclostridium sp. X23]